MLRWFAVVVLIYLGCMGYFCLCDFVVFVLCDSLFGFCVLEVVLCFWMLACVWWLDWFELTWI